MIAERVQRLIRSVAQAYLGPKLGVRIALKGNMFIIARRHEGNFPTGIWQIFPTSLLDLFEPSRTPPFGWYTLVCRDHNFQKTRGVSVFIHPSSVRTSKKGSKWWKSLGVQREIDHISFESEIIWVPLTCPRENLDWIIWTVSYRMTREWLPELYKMVRVIFFSGTFLLFNLSSARRRLLDVMSDSW